MPPPPPSPARANFTLMTECTPESSGCYSVYSVADTGAVEAGGVLLVHGASAANTGAVHVW